MIIKTEALPIRMAGFGSSSQIVTWLTAEHGKISTTIKGAQRPKRVGGGQYDLGYRCELLFYEREINGLHTFKDCTALENRNSLRGNWQKTAVLSYLCLVAGLSSLPAMKNPVLYEYLLKAISGIEAGCPLGSLLVWFELQALKLHGTPPQLTYCAVCRKEPQPPYALSAQIGGLICPKCNASRKSTVHSISVSALRQLARMQNLQKPVPATHNSLQDNLQDQFAVALGEMMQIWLDTPPNARSVAIQMANISLKTA